MHRIPEEERVGSSAAQVTVRLGRVAEELEASPVRDDRG